MARRVEDRRRKHRECCRAWYRKNIVRLRKIYKAYSRKRRKTHPEKSRQASRKYYYSHPKEVSAYGKKYYKKNRPKIGKYNNKYIAKRCREDVEFGIRRRLRARLYDALYGSDRRNHSNVVDLLGCSLDKLKKHIEDRFLPTMSWENHGSVWHIDHIRPCASFDLRDFEQQKKCFNYNNLQPLFAKDNLLKSSKWKGKMIRRSVSWE